MSNLPMRRVYYFTPPDHALDNLREERLKVSRFSECNDAFELAALNLKDEKLRRRFRGWLGQTDKRFGLLCFCRGWKSPVLWSHYAKNHSGVCYGFDVDPKNFVDVRYVSERLYPNLSHENFFKHVGPEQMSDLFATKFIHWSYEEEVRLLIPIPEEAPKGELMFYPFSDEMQLKQVIVGHRSNIKIPEAKAIVADKRVEVFKARLAFQRFEVIEQRNKSLW